MSNKEYVTVVLDVSHYMNSKSNGSSTDFETALQLVFKYFIQQLLKNRKLDRYAFILYAAGRIEFFYENEPLSLSRVKEFYKLAKDVHFDEAKEKLPKNHILEAFDKALLNQIANKFRRNVFVVTNASNNKIPQAYINDHANSTASIITKYPIDCTFVFMDNIDSYSIEQYFETVPLVQNHIHLYKYQQYKKFGPGLKLISPRCLCETYMSFARIGGSESEGINFRIQVYPATKVQSLIRGHEYIVDPNRLETARVKKETSYYINKSSTITNEIFDFVKDEGHDNAAVDGEYEYEEGKQNEKKELKYSELCHGFKYSQRNVLALVPELEQEATLATLPGINILGFIDIDKLPITYYSDESLYIIPSNKFYSDNRIAFNSFAQSLMNLKSAAIVRYVQKEDDEVQICAVVPQYVNIEKKHEEQKEDKVKIEVRYGNEDIEEEEKEKEEKEEEEKEKTNKTGLVLLMVRLAMKEDEMAGRFPPLTEMDHTLADSQMEDFIRCKSLDNDQTEPTVIDNMKTGLMAAKTLSPPVSSNSSLERMLLSQCPSTKRFNYYIEKLLYQSLDKKSLQEFIKEDGFIEKYLTGDEEHSLFNMNDILNVGENYFLDERKIEKSNDIAIELKKQLDVSFKLNERKLYKKKRKYEEVFGAESIEGNFDQYFDVDEMLS